MYKRIKLYQHSLEFLISFKQSTQAKVEENLFRNDGGLKPTSDSLKKHFKAHFLYIYLKKKADDSD